MSETYPVLRSLDPHHARVGYLGALASVASRGLDIPEALTARFHELLFERFYPDDPRFQKLMTRVPEPRRGELMRRMAKESLDNPWSALADLNKPAGWLWLSEFWLFDSMMPSAIGFLNPDRVDGTIQLARWTGILQSTFELSEVGFLLQSLLTEAAQRPAQGLPFNFLNPSPRPAVPLIYLRQFLGAEMLFPFLIGELVEREAAGLPTSTSGKHGLLRHAIERMMKVVGNPTDPDDILPFRELTIFNDSVLGKASTEENYLRPRMEILVDLGLIGRTAEGEAKRNELVWTVTDVTKRLAQEWRSLEAPKNRIPRYLDSAFFSGMSRVYGKAYPSISRDEERLLWFARAYRRIGREIGFTPGRTLAYLACLLGWEAGVLLEIDQIFDAVYAAAKSHWERYLHFSGGSRLDREFLIVVDEGLEGEIVKNLGTDREPGPSGGNKP